MYTVPFGDLGAVQNMSRDWVIDKFQVNVAYDTDLEKARKLIKKIGQDIAADATAVRTTARPRCPSRPGRCPPMGRHGRCRRPR